MNIVSTLNDELLKQPFLNRKGESMLLDGYQQVARMYAKVENSIAVLSDLKSKKSYIYYGGFSERLGVADREDSKEIRSIWEENIFHKIHPDDLAEKHLLELYFFRLLKTLPIEERSDYHITSEMRMLDNTGKYIGVCHRMFYVWDCSSGSLWLAFCLYNHSYERFPPETSSGMIVNSVTGNIIKPDKRKYSNILSSREKDVLLLIEKGKISKEIAEVLSISKNTVDRHRQNILEKLQVNNSFEACRVARLLGLI